MLSRRNRPSHKEQFLLLIKELIQYGVVLSGEIGEMDVSVIDTMRSLAEVMISEIERPVNVGRGARRPQVDIKEEQLREVLSPSVPFPTGTSTTSADNHVMLT